MSAATALPHRRSQAQESARALADERRVAFWLTTFVVVQILCQLLMMSESIGSMRVIFRSAVFLMSAGFLIVVPGREHAHPAKLWMVSALLVVALAVFHPTTNAAMAGIAHFTLYLSIAAPLFWVTRLAVTDKILRRIILILWVFHTASAAVGVLQMHFPGRFQPSVSSTIRGMGEMADAYKMRLADGTTVWRPMGLTDTPGGAAGAGLYAVVFSLGVYIQRRAGWFKVLSAGGFLVGSFCLYIGQVRSLLVMAVICVAALVWVLSRRGELKRCMELAFLVPVMGALSFYWAARVGGEETEKRNNSLVETARLDQTYQKNRGFFLSHTVYDLLPQYPLGAGLARWGMMRGYFGDERNTDSPMIWVEIQFTGWLLDGGIPLILLYSTAVLMTVWMSYRIALSRRTGELPLWAALLFALNIASVAVTFNYPLFIGQGGMEFWFLNCALYMAAVTADRKSRSLSMNAGAAAAGRRTLHQGPTRHIAETPAE